MTALRLSIEILLLTITAAYLGTFEDRVADRVAQAMMSRMDGHCLTGAENAKRIKR